MTRRELLTGAAALAGAAAIPRTAGAQEPPAIHPSAKPKPADGKSEPPAWTRPPHAEPGEPGRHYTPTVTLNGSTLPWKLVDGVKVFHLIAEEVRDHEFAPGLKAHCWGYNGQVHGPTIECVEGDRVRIYVTNRLPAATSVHWHGLILPNGMDGVGGLTQRAIQPGETFKYEFTLWQHGTFMYHSHHDEMTQMALGLMGMIVIHAREPKEPLPDRDFVYLLSEWKIVPGTMRPDPNEMTDFNMLTLNARVFPGTAPIVVKTGDRVRIRIGNLSAMDHHPIHFHGHYWWVIATDGGDIPASARWPEVTVLVPVGSTRTVEFIASNPGDWAMHCHMTHHVMTQMGHGLPNLIGINTEGFDRRLRKLVPGYMTMGDTGMGDMGEMGMKVPRNSLPMIGAKGPHDYITMGGMYTNIKVRDHLESYDKDPGWYERPPGTIADLAGTDELKRDLGFVPDAKPGKGNGGHRPG
jgi:FtsP/CotA-like multicopper oxidase with cupredoxin domain